MAQKYKGFPTGIKDPVQYFAAAHHADNTYGIDPDEMSRVDEYKAHLTADNVDPQLIQEASSAGLLRAMDIIREQQENQKRAKYN
jgi:hypothetical protein